MSRNKKRGVNQCQAYNFRSWGIYDGFPVAEVDEVGKLGAISCNGFPVGFRWVSGGFPVGSRGHTWPRKHRKQRWPTVEK